MARIRGEIFRFCTGCKRSLCFAKTGTNLVAKGFGSTGRTTAVNITEQLAMKEIMSNPTIGKTVMTRMKDSRCLGWDKMQWYIVLSTMIKIRVCRFTLKNHIRSGEENFMGLLGSLICVHFASKQWVHIRRNVQLNN